MGLYLGSKKVKINSNSVIYSAKFFTTVPIVNGIALLSADNYMLKDKNGLYLTAKESE